MKKIKQLCACLSLIAFGLSSAHADYTLNLMEGVTQISNDLYGLHMLIFWICVFIGLAVFGVMFYSIYHHRKSKGHVAEQFHENTTVEIIWTIIPTLILIAMAIPATYKLLEMDDVQDAQLSIKVTGWQWKWEYEYTDSGIHFFSSLDEASNKARQVGSGIDPRTVPHYLLNVDHPLVIPVKTKIRFMFTAKDVIHSWWVPDLGWKKDANPGFVNEAWTSVDKPGTYRGQCTELCGKDHGFMPIVVIAMAQPDYDAWVKKTLQEEKEKGDDIGDRSRADLMAGGAAIYEKNCSSCHMADGAGIAGAFPALTKSAVVTGDINAQAKLVVQGKGMMPAFGSMLTPVELAQVITYTRNALGNNVGDEIQPKAIAAMLSKGPAAKEEPASDKKEAAPVAAAPEATTAAVELSLDELKTKGEAVYQAKCAACHQADGKGMPGFAPAITESAVVTGDLNKQVELVMKGKNAMPAFGKTLSAEDFAAVVTYTRNALGNNVGDLIQSADVKSLMSGASD